LCWPVCQRQQLAPVAAEHHQLRKNARPPADPTVLYDTWDQCEAQIEDRRFPISGALPACAVPWEEQGPAAHDYFAMISDMHWQIVKRGPYTLDLAVLLGTARTAAVQGDDRITVRYETNLTGGE
jgi:hypothetical protein